MNGYNNGTYEWNMSGFMNGIWVGVLMENTMWGPPKDS